MCNFGKFWHCFGKLCDETLICMNVKFGVVVKSTEATNWYKFNNTPINGLRVRCNKVAFLDLSKICNFNGISTFPVFAQKCLGEIDPNSTQIRYFMWTSTNQKEFASTYIVLDFVQLGINM